MTTSESNPTLADLVGLWLEDNRPMFEIVPSKSDKKLMTIQIKKAKMRNALVFIWHDNVNILRHEYSSVRVYAADPTLFDQLKEHLDRHYYEHLKEVYRTSAYSLKPGQLTAAQIAMFRDSLQANIDHYKEAGNFDLLIQRLIEARTRKDFSPESDIVPSL